MNSGIEHIVATVPVPKSEFEDEAFHNLVHGNAFPASPVERQLFYRDDEHIWYIYNGTDWQSTAAAAIDELNDIGDVNVPTPADQQGIEWDEATSKWILAYFIRHGLLTARGDIITRSATVPKRLALGTEGHYLKAGASEPEWAAPAVGSQVIWKDASTSPLVDTDRTETIDWTDLDLTAHTSVDAKVAIIKLAIKLTSYTSGYVYIGVRKKGTTPTYFPMIYGCNLPEADKTCMNVVLCGMDAGQVIEYKIVLSGTATLTSYIQVLGYIE